MAVLNRPDPLVAVLVGPVQQREVVLARGSAGSGGDLPTVGAHGDGGVAALMRVDACGDDEEAEWLARIVRVLHAGANREV
ncbi:hypothetical protein AB0G04_35050 [Actinoplanes sp. NPDC023801]|uniref:hypothetical protein n=1 Tax=Actinoplanes sp. NPDC023801 TaxID=3154595 RepID=UPI003411CD15